MAVSPAGGNRPLLAVQKVPAGDVPPGAKAVTPANLGSNRNVPTEQSMNLDFRGAPFRPLNLIDNAKPLAGDVA